MRFIHRVSHLRLKSPCLGESQEDRGHPFLPEGESNPFGFLQIGKSQVEWGGGKGGGKHFLLRKAPLHLPGQQGVGQLDILHDGFLSIPLTVHGVGGGQEGGPGVQLADDPRLGDGQGLLFHHLVQNGPRTVIHFIELVYTAHSSVAQH